MVITVECTSCSSSFLVDTRKVPAAGVYARCSRCSGVFFVAGVPEETLLSAEEPPPPVGDPGPPAEEPVPPHAPSEGWVAEGPPASEVEEARTAEPEQAPTGDGAEAVGERSDAEMPASGGAAESGPAAEAGTGWPELGQAEPPVQGTEAAGDAAQSGAPPDALPAGEAGPWGAVEVPRPDGVDGEAAASEAPPEPREGTRPSSPAPFSFGRRDPHEKAQRLARVLVSDMLIYNPERHRRAVEQGSLREDFDDEIRRSWQEYTAQVGDELATGTSYFNDALNDILAGGEKLFP